MTIIQVMNKQKQANEPRKKNVYQRKNEEKRLTIISAQKGSVKLKTTGLFTW